MRLYCVFQERTTFDGRRNRLFGVYDTLDRAEMVCDYLDNRVVKPEELYKIVPKEVMDDCMRDMNLFDKGHKGYTREQISEQFRRIKLSESEYSNAGILCVELNKIPQL